MSGLFAGASFFNGIMSNWNVSSVKYINSMFYQAAAFNQDISSWDVRSVTNMNSTFRNAVAFDKNITGWNTPAIVAQGYANTENMFFGATAWLAAYSAVTPTVRTDGPPSLWVSGAQRQRRPSDRPAQPAFSAQPAPRAPAFRTKTALPAQSALPVLPAPRSKTSPSGVALSSPSL